MSNRIDFILKGIYWFLGGCFCVLAVIAMVQNDKNSIMTKVFLLFMPIWTFVIGLIFLYGYYYLNWGEKQFDRFINTRWRFFLLSKNKDKNILITKISMFAFMGISVIFFIVVFRILKL